MANKKNMRITVLFVLSVSMMSAMLTAMYLIRHDSNSQFRLLGCFCQILIEEKAADPDKMMMILKKNKNRINRELYAYKSNLLKEYGYSDADFTGDGWEQGYFLAAMCYAAGAGIFLFSFFYWHSRDSKRMRELADFLEKARMGTAEILAASEEGEYFRLQDEIYKTVTQLYQTRDDALAAKRRFADHLYDIAHQLKTPITAISLSAQMMEASGSEYPGKIREQAGRLAYLEEALLLLSRVDSGTLVLKKKKTDVFTLLSLAADSLQELFVRSGVIADVAEMGEAEIFVDVEWTVEAIMNLMKNCMEYSPAGAAVHCVYEQNPLYVKIRIWDEGDGFAKEDLPHLFERFYRGKRAGGEGIGIGLSLAKEILEMQNGMVSAGNLPEAEGGAYFEARLYHNR